MFTLSVRSSPYDYIREYGRDSKPNEPASPRRRLTMIIAITVDGFREAAKHSFIIGIGNIYCLMFGNFPIKVTSIQKFALNAKKLRPLNGGLKPQKLGPHCDFCLHSHFNIE